MFSGLAKFALEFLKREDGPTSVEYAIQLALIISFCISTIGQMTSKTNATFTTVASKLGSASS